MQHIRSNLQSAKIKDMIAMGHLDSSYFSYLQLACYIRTMLFIIQLAKIGQNGGGGGGTLASPDMRRGQVISQRAPTPSPLQARRRRVRQ